MPLLTPGPSRPDGPPLAGHCARITAPRAAAASLFQHQQSRSFTERFAVAAELPHDSEGSA